MLFLGTAGNIGVAAYDVIANISLVTMSIFNGLAQGIQPLTSEPYGCGDKPSVKKLLRWGLITCLILELLIVAASWLFTDPLVNIFNSEQNLELLRYAHTGLRLYFLGFLIAVSTFFWSLTTPPSTARGRPSSVLCYVGL